jgi:imidazolonepropionase
MKDIGRIEGADILIKNGKISFIGNILTDQLDPHTKVIDAKGCSVLPGFVDSHTHFIFGGYRQDEFMDRLQGVPYMEIMKRGGGIINSVKATRKATYEELISSGKKRLASMLSFGVTTVEGKSGYGLDLETEMKQLRVMKELNTKQPVDIVSTYMGAHAVAPEFEKDPDRYIDFIISDILPKVKEEKLAEFCDVFCEKNVFSIEQSEKLLTSAKKLGMGIKAHADEIVPFGGAAMAARVGATSADHLLKASSKDISQMSKSNVVATLLPLTAFSLNEEYADARMMIERDCAVALATDMNPGSCFSESIPLLISLAAIYMKMSIEEIIVALTINGAAAVGREKTIGSIDIGKEGDILILDSPSYKFLAYHIGVSSVQTVIKSGKVVFSKGGENAY